MPTISFEQYRNSIKSQRILDFPSPYDLVYEVFVKNRFDTKDAGFFRENASFIVESLRKSCWETYVPLEKDFTRQMLVKLIDADSIKDMSPQEAVVWFAETYPEHIYQLSLSNTQSRRSRAGKEFEAIIELILTGAGIPMDTQGNIGKKTFVNKGLGKLVDAVSPGVVEYGIDKNDVVLITAKTTLRERWQEVPEEMGRTGAKEMFLATLDESITTEVLDTLYESNIRIVTTKSVKEKCYHENKRVLSFERLIDICNGNLQQWDGYKYSADEIKSIKDSIEIQLQKHTKHDFLVQYYYERLKKLV